MPRGKSVCLLYQEKMHDVWYKCKIFNWNLGLEKHRKSAQSKFQKKEKASLNLFKGCVSEESSWEVHGYCFWERDIQYPPFTYRVRHKTSQLEGLNEFSLPPPPLSIAVVYSIHHQAVVPDAQLDDFGSRGLLLVRNLAKETVHKALNEISRTVTAAAVATVLIVHKIENFFGFDFEFCTISMLAMHK